MSTQYLSIEGMVKWNHIFKPSERFNKFEIQLYPNKEGMEKYRSSGMQMKVNTDEDGEFIKLSRPVDKIINGELANFGPPEVVDSDNNVFSQIIGHGSKILVDIITYGTIKGVGHRFNKITVLEHVKYDPDADQEAPAPKDNSVATDEVSF